MLRQGREPKEAVALFRAFNKTSVWCVMNKSDVYEPDTTLETVSIPDRFESLSVTVIPRWYFTIHDKWAIGNNSADKHNNSQLKWPPVLENNDKSP